MSVKSVEINFKTHLAKSEKNVLFREKFHLSVCEVSISHQIVRVIYTTSSKRIYCITLSSKLVLLKTSSLTAIYTYRRNWTYACPSHNFLPICVKFGTQYIHVALLNICKFSENWCSKKKIPSPEGMNKIFPPYFYISSWYVSARISRVTVSWCKVKQCCPYLTYERKYISVRNFHIYFFPVMLNSI
jgi:hypothetical protein